MTAEPFATYREFTNLAFARAYRHSMGTGGWIFVDDLSGQAILFPPHLPPSAIMTHRLTAGRSGKLIGAA